VQQYRSYCRNILDGATSANHAILMITSVIDNGVVEVTDGWYQCAMRCSPEDPLVAHLGRHRLIRVQPAAVSGGTLFVHSNCVRAVRKAKARDGLRVPWEDRLGEIQRPMPPMQLRDVLPWIPTIDEPPIVPHVDVIVLKVFQDAIWAICTRDTVTHRTYATMGRITLKCEEIKQHQLPFRLRLTYLGPDQSYPKSSGPKILFSTEKTTLTLAPHPLPFNLPSCPHCSLV